MQLADAKASFEDVAERIPHAGARQDARNLQIQWLRALAAVFVVLFHATGYGVMLRGDHSFVPIISGRFGMTGVSLFFAISGYLMATAIRVQDPFTFLSHRVIRIYPVFLFVVALYCTSGYLLGHPVPVNFAALTLAPVGATAKYPLSIEWTLVFEVTFYVALFLIGLGRLARYLPYIALLWLAMLAGSSLYHPDISDLRYPVQRILLVSENVGMAGGLLIPWLLRLRMPSLLLIAIGATAWPLHSFHPMGNDGTRWLFGIGATLVVAGAIAFSARRPDFGDNRVGRALARFGDYSYALYLVHIPVIYTLYSRVHHAPFALLWACAVTGAILASLVIGPLDVRVYRRLKSYLKTVRPRRVRIAIWLYLTMMLGVAAPAGWKLHLEALRQDAANDAAVAIVNAGPIDTPEQLAADAMKAGFVLSPELTGGLDSAGMATDVDALQITGWAVDTTARKGDMAVVLFQNGRFLSAVVTSYGRGDLRERFGGTKAMTGFAVRVPIACTPDKDIVAVVLGPNHGFAVLPQTIRPDCKAK